MSIAADLEAPRAPTPIPVLHGTAAIVSPFLTTGMAIEQQALDPHIPIDPACGLGG
jgi:hypothetical protein